MAESTQVVVVERPDILANAVVTGPNVLPLDPNAAPQVPGEPVAVEGEDTATAPAEAPVAVESEEDEAAQEETTESAVEAEETPPSQAPRKHSAAARFSDLTHERDAAKQEMEYWKQVALQRAAQEEHQQVQAPPQPDIPRYPNGAPIPPVEAEFQTHQDFQAAQQMYVAAAVEWGVSRKFAEYRAEQEAAQALKVVQERYPDYTEVVRNTRVRLNNDVSAAVLASAQKHEIIYRLATHPDEADALVNMHGPQAFLAIGRLEEVVRAALPDPAKAPSAPSAPPVSQAPPPIQPTRGNGATATRGYDDMDLHEFIAARNKEETRRRR